MVEKRAVADIFINSVTFYLINLLYLFFIHKYNKYNLSNSILLLGWIIV